MLSFLKHEEEHVEVEISARTVGKMVDASMDRHGFWIQAVLLCRTTRPLPVESFFQSPRCPAEIFSKSHDVFQLQSTIFAKIITDLTWCRFIVFELI